MIEPALLEEAAELLAACREKGRMIATAESCTGGLIAATLTAVAGSSDVVDRGFVTYSNEAKSELLGLPMALIEEHGAVSEAVARAMAEAALSRSRATLAVSCTGIAGPDGGSAEKPVGRVHLAAAAEGRAVIHRRCDFGGVGRDEVRTRSVAVAFALLRRQLEDR